MSIVSDELKIDSSKKVDHIYFRLLKSTIKWVIGVVIVGIFVNHMYDINKDSINRSLRYVLKYKYVEAAERGNSLVITADRESSSGNIDDASDHYQKALANLTLAAENGIVEAMRDLGLILCAGRRGYIVPDPKNGAIWLIKASEAGEVKAKYRLRKDCRAPD